MVAYIVIFTLSALCAGFSVYPDVVVDLAQHCGLLEVKEPVLTAINSIGYDSTGHVVITLDGVTTVHPSEEEIKKAIIISVEDNRANSYSLKQICYMWDLKDMKAFAIECANKKLTDSIDPIDTIDKLKVAGDTISSSNDMKKMVVIETINCFLEDNKVDDKVMSLLPEDMSEIVKNGVMSIIEDNMLTLDSINNITTHEDFVRNEFFKEDYML